MNKDKCPKCKSDNIANEGPPEDGQLEMTCHDCSHQWAEDLLTDIDDIGRRMKSQDNRATADPYIIVLQEKVTVPTCEGHGSRTVYYHPDYDGTYESVKAFKEAHDYQDATDLQSYEVKDIWEDRNWFFTYEGYDEHVRLNKHNYGEIRNYIKHLFRNPEMKAVWDYIVKKGFGRE